MQKRFNLSYIWVTGIFIILLIILLLVVEYKVKYEDNTFYKYLYFYKCESSFCTTDNIDEISDHSTLLSVYKYDYHGNVPTYEYVVEDYIIINDNDNYLYYNFVRGSVLNDYDSYKNFDNKYLIVKEKIRYGLIDIDNNILLNLSYDYIDYIDEYIVTIKDNILNIKDINLENIIEFPIEMTYNSNIELNNDNNIITINIDNIKYSYDLDKKEVTKG